MSIYRNMLRQSRGSEGNAHLQRAACSLSSAFTVFSSSLLRNSVEPYPSHLGVAADQGSRLPASEAEQGVCFGGSPSLPACPPTRLPACNLYTHHRALGSADVCVCVCKVVLRQKQHVLTVGVLFISLCNPVHALK